jgi:hypothetical protein
VPDNLNTYGSSGGSLTSNRTVTFNSQYWCLSFSKA